MSLGAPCDGQEEEGITNSTTWRRPPASRRGKECDVVPAQPSSLTPLFSETTAAPTERVRCHAATLIGESAIP